MPVSEVAQVAEAQAPSGAHRATVTVQGHWTLEVRDPDGTTVARREFDNDFTDPPHRLGTILARERAVGRWEVWVGKDLTLSTTADQPCEGPSYRTLCQIVEPSDPREELGWVSETLSVTPVQADHTLVLEGHITAQRDSSVQWVGTGVGYCPPDVSPADCPTSAAHLPQQMSNGGLYTTHELTRHSATADDAIPVLAGQQILVKVVLEFGGA
ncbi:MAG: hypothetical protein JRI25_22455 [Deltaproteobacteria bacterium]|nr:hypothetical protein [Deltaproteobacteria bacterium]